MRVLTLPLALASLVAVFAQSSDFLTPYTIYAYGINATFIPYGARITSLYVHDRDNNPKQMVVGYDDLTQYPRDTATNHTYFGAIVGRYANRIKNGTFVIGDETYHVPENEHGGLDTLHGGDFGYDQCNWTVTAYNTSSITFSLMDPSGEQGFPGAVISYVTYSVSPATDTIRGRLTNRIVSIPLDQATPIMLSTHIYWNIGAFQSPTIANDTLQMPYADRIITIDSLEVPTGQLQSVLQPWQSPSVPLNFTGQKPISEGLTAQQCGDNCVGIDNAFILDRPVYSSPDSAESPQLIWYSPDTGITMSVRTNQQSLQIYTCVGQNGTVFGHDSVPVEKYGCMVIEPQQWIDGINHPEWGQMDRQIFAPDTPPAVNWASYEFMA